jgi:hypothetical protein
MNSKSEHQLRDRSRPDLNQKQLEHFYESFDHFEQILLKDRDEGNTFEQLAEGYLKGKLKIHVHCRVLSLGSGDTQEFCAMFQGKPLGRQSLQRTRSLGKKPVRIPSLVTSIDEIVATGGRYEKSVLVYDIEAMESPKIIEFPSLVWLQQLDTRDHFGARARYFSCNLGFNVGDSRKPISDREGGVVIGRSAANQAQLPSEVIETGSQIVDRITQNDKNLRRTGLDDFEFGNAVSCIGLIIWNCTVGVTFAEQSEFRFEALDVLFGPMDFSSD